MMSIPAVFLDTLYSYTPSVRSAGSKISPKNALVAVV